MPKVRWMKYLRDNLRDVYKVDVVDWMQNLLKHWE